MAAKRPALDDVAVNLMLRARVEKLTNQWRHILDDEATYQLTGGPSTYDAYDVANEALRNLAELATLIGRPPCPRAR